VETDMASRQANNTMTKKLIVIMATTDPRKGDELGVPIFQASAAATMGYETTVICTATASRFMKKGVAERVYLKRGDNRTLYHFVKDAHFAGVRFYCCSPSDDVYDTRPDDLIAECAGVIGRRQLIEQIMDNDDVKVLSY
jgi:predicted peroxiredoxin